MSDEAKIPVLPVYERPTTVGPATIPESIAQKKPPGSLNKLIGKMLKLKLPKIRKIKNPKFKSKKLKKYGY